MSPIPQTFKRRYSLRPTAVVIFMIGLAALWGGAYFVSEKARQEALSAGQARSELLAKAFGEHANAALKMLDVVSLAMSEKWLQNPATFAEDTAPYRKELEHLAVQFGVADSKGILVYTDLGPQPKPVDLSDRAHVSVHLAGKSSGGLFISEPILGRVSKKWVIQVSRGIMREGKVIGVLVISVDPEFFHRFYSDISLGTDDIVAMIRQSGHLLVRAPGNQAFLGQLVSGPYLGENAPLRGNFQRVAQTDGIERIYGYYRLPQYGLVLTAALAMDNVLATYRSRQRATALTGLATSAALLFVMLLVVRSIEEREKRAAMLAKANLELDARVRSRTQELRESEERMRLLLDSLQGHCILMLDLEGRVASWNASAERMKGYRAAEIVGQSHEVFYTKEERLSARPAKLLRTATETGRAEDSGERVRKDGSRFWAQVIISAVRDTTGSLRGFAKVTRDISVERRLQDELREMQKLEAIGQLTGGLAHDFNNLLGIVVGNLDLIEDELPGGERLRRRLDTARGAALRGAEVTRSLLAVARRQPLEIGEYDVNALIAEMMPLVRSSAGAAVQVRSQFCAGALLARLDAAGLSNVVLNLVINARDAMQGQARESVVTLRTRAERVDADAGQTLAPGEYAVIEVADTGGGMSEAVRAQAFEPFFTTKERGRGTGLGLAMVYGFAEQLGGTARIDSRPGAGTTVSVWLPLDPAAAAGTEDKLAQTSPLAKMNPQALERRHILVVDDEPELCALACTWLESLGYEASQTHSPTDALARLAERRFDLLLADVVMPGGMDGVALAREAIRTQPGLRVLYCSGYADGLLEDDTIPGALLNKPYRKSDLARAVRKSFDT